MIGAIDFTAKEIWSMVVLFVVSLGIILYILSGARSSLRAFFGSAKTKRSNRPSPDSEN